MTKDITTQTEQLPASDADKTFLLLQQAVEQGNDVEKLVALQERIMDRNAKSDFMNAMADFQARCPAVTKRHSVKDRGGRVMYHYAPLEDIVAQIKELLADLGLSYSFSSEATDRGINVVCTIRHRAGHSEDSTAFIPTTKGMNTNSAQDMVIQLTYGKRQTLISALGITTADEDTDGVTQTVAPITDAQVADLVALAIEVKADSAKFLKYMGVSSFEEIAKRDHERAVAALESKRKKS